SVNRRRLQAIVSQNIEEIHPIALRSQLAQKVDVDVYRLAEVVKALVDRVELLAAGSADEIFDLLFAFAAPKLKIQLLERGLLLVKGKALNLVKSLEYLILSGLVTEVEEKLVECLSGNFSRLKQKERFRGLDRIVLDGLEHGLLQLAFSRLEISQLLG